MLRRLLRLCAKVLLVLLPLVVLAGAGAWLWRLPLAGWLAETLAARQGLPLQLTVTVLDTDRATLRDLRLGSEDSITARAVRAEYRLADLLDGAVDRVEVDGLRLSAIVDDGGFRLPAFDGLAGDGDGGSPSLPALVLLSDARAEIATPQGPVTVAGDATLKPDAAGLQIDGDLALALGGNRLAGKVSLNRRNDGEIVARLDLTGGAAERDGIALTLARGTVDLAWNPATQSLPRLDGTLALPSLALRDLRLGATRLDLASDGHAVQATIETATADGAMRLAATLDLQDAAGDTPTAALVATLDFDRLAPFAEIAGHGRVEIDGFAALPPLDGPLPDPGDVPAEATLRFDLAGLALAAVSDGTVTASLHARTTADGAVVVELGRPATAAGNIPDPVAVTFQPTDAPLATIAWRDRRAGGRVRAEIAAPAGTVALAADYTAAVVDDGWRLDLPSFSATAATLAIDAVALSDLAVNGRDARLRRADGVSIEVAIAEASAARWSAAGLAGTARIGASDIAWSPDRIAGRARVDVAAGGAGLRDGRLRGEVTVAGTPDAYELRLADCARLTLRRFAEGTVSVTGGPLTLCQADRPALRKAEAVDVALRLRPSTWQIEAQTPLTLQLAALELEATLADGGWTAQLAGKGSGVEAPDLQIGAEEVDIDAAWAGPGDARLTLDVAWLRDRRPAPRFMPMKLAAEASLRGDALGASGTIRDRGEQMTLAFSAEHDLGSGRGSARIATDPPFAFAPEGAQPQRLVPLLRGKVTSVDGLVDAEASAAWGDGALDTAATLEATSVGAQTPIAVLAGLSGKLAFTSLWPPATAERQQISLATLDVGVPLSDGTAEITLQPDGRLAIHRAGWPWAGGRIHVEDEVIDPAAERLTLTLRVDDVDLVELVKLTENEALELTGRVGGEIPVEIVGDSVFVRQARLASLGSGTLRYVSEGGDAVLERGGGGSELLADALRDFRYDSLVLTLDGETTGELNLGVQVVGFSPKVYNGSPVELNVAVGGALLEMVRQGLAGYRIPDNIVRQLRGESDDAPQPVASGAAGDPPAPRVVRPDSEARGP